MNTRLLEDFSVETTARGADRLAAVTDLLPAGTRVAIPFLDGDDLAALTAAARTVGELGFRPVPHLAARRIRSAAELAGHLSAIAGLTDEIFLVGGDPSTPAGPFRDALAVIRSGLLAGGKVHTVGLPAYPAVDGQPVQLAEKVRLLAAQGLDAELITQFAGPDEVLTWLDRTRAGGLHLPVRVGVAGAAGIPPRLAARLGLPQAEPGGPDAFLDAIADGHDPGRHGELRLHFAPFHAVRQTAEWIAGRRLAMPEPAAR